MDIIKSDAKSVGSCNFCNKGRVSAGRMVRPYRKVYELSGNGNRIRLCPSCFKEVLSTKT